MSTAHAWPPALFGTWPGDATHCGTRRVPCRCRYAIAHLLSMVGREPCCGRGAQAGNCSATELPEHRVLRAGVEPATCRLGGDNRLCFGPQQEESSRSWGAVGTRTRTARLAP